VSEAEAIAVMLSGDADILAAVGTEERIQLGKFTEHLPYAPPLILISTRERLPAIEGEDGVLAETCHATIGLMVDQGLDALAARLTALLEESGYRLEEHRRLAGPRREWHHAELSFSTTRLR